ncbi:MAG: ATP-binding protein [Candidatus Kapabacteria bacterium]|nr:ATP-binding protein [Candidatus Kapabacteria bacterium]
MKRHELRELIACGESSTLEFKRKFTTVEKIAREVIALANTTGGYLLLGVDDNGKVVGVDSEKEQIDQLQVALHTIDPPIQCQIDVVELDYRDVVVVCVPASSARPHHYVGDMTLRPHDRPVFIRDGEQSVQASREMTKILRGMNPDSPPLTLSIGDRERRLFSYLERHQRASVTDFARLVNISRRRASQILVKLVRAGVLHIRHDNGHDYYTLV